MKPSGVSVAEFVCPSCGDTIGVPVLIESERSRNPAEIRVAVMVDQGPIREHIATRHERVA